VNRPPAPVTTDGEIVINAICGGDPISCETEDHCERMQDVCPDTGVTVVEDRYYVEPEGTQLHEGDPITLYHTKKGYYTVTESFDPTLCNSDCFNSCYENCAYAELQDCYLGCTRGVPVSSVSTGGMRKYVTSIRTGSPAASSVTIPAIIAITVGRIPHPMRNGAEEP